MEIIFINGKPYVKQDDEYREATPYELMESEYID
jgi:hypothetical protein